MSSAGTEFTILYLCANEKTAGLDKPKLYPVVQKFMADDNMEHINMKSIRHMFAGMDIKYPSENKCFVNFIEDDLIARCGYRAKQFNIIVLEYCPVVLENSLFNNKHFLHRIYTLLKHEGMLIVPGSQAKSRCGNNTLLATVKHHSATPILDAPSMSAPSLDAAFSKYGFVKSGCINHHSKMTSKGLKNHSFFAYRKTGK